MSDDNKTSPKLWATVTILVAIIGCAGTVLATVLPKLFEAPGPVVTTTATQLAILATSSPLPIITTTLPLVTELPTSNVLQPTSLPVITSTLIPTSVPTASTTSNMLIYEGQTWKGNFNQDSPQYPDFTMIMHFENVAGNFFSGKLRYDVNDNPIFTMQGEIVTDFGDFVERNRWSYVPNFDKDQSGLWIKFTNPQQLAGGSGWIVDSKFYAHVKTDSTIVGVWFWHENDSKPSGDFLLFISQ